MNALTCIVCTNVAFIAFLSQSIYELTIEFIDHINLYHMKAVTYQYIGTRGIFDHIDLVSITWLMDIRKILVSQLSNKMHSSRVSEDCILIPLVYVLPWRKNILIKL